MNKRKAGAALWLTGLLTFPLQLITASRWLEPYSFRNNLISDLGVTTCGDVDEGSRVERYICSPWHDLANASTIGNGIFIALGAILLWNAWPHVISGRIAMTLMAMGGLLVIGVGVFPWNTHPDEHNLTAILQVFFQWAGMAFLLISLRKSHEWRLATWSAAFCLAVSVIGFALFIDAIGGGFSAVIGIGATERLAFDSLTIWAFLIGWVLMRTAADRRTKGSSPVPTNVR